MLVQLKKILINNDKNKNRNKRKNNRKGGVHADNAEEKPDTYNEFAESDET